MHIILVAAPCMTNVNASFSAEEPDYQNPGDQQSKSVDLSKLPSLIQSISIMCNGIPVSIQGRVRICTHKIN